MEIFEVKTLRAFSYNKRLSLIYISWLVVIGYQKQESRLESYRAAKQ